MAKLSRITGEKFDINRFGFREDIADDIVLCFFTAHSVYTFSVIIFECIFRTGSFGEFESHGPSNRQNTTTNNNNVHVCVIVYVLLCVFV